MKSQCLECGRLFDLLVPEDAEEWYGGHDCEPVTVVIETPARNADPVLTVYEWAKGVK